MKNLFVTALLVALVAGSPLARAEAPATPSLCQSGSAIGACPSGVQSNVTSNTSVAPGQTSITSVTGYTSDNSVGARQNTNESVAARQGNSNSSVAWSQSPTDSVAGQSSNTSVADNPGSTSVVH